jgi:N-acetylneuraminic acid mutarotase
MDVSVWRVGSRRTLMRAPAVLILALASGAVATGTANAESWTETAPLIQLRANHTATLLRDGRVLVTGGTAEVDAYGLSGKLDSVELFDPSTNSWTAPTARLNAARSNHTATLLKDGRVLVVGGGGPPGSFELFDPASGVWTMPAGTLNHGRSGHTATLLPDGRVLVAGGGTPVIEVFDPFTETWSVLTDDPGTGGHPAVLLADGRVLFLQGDTHTIYDPADDSWSPGSGNLNQARSGATATLLPDGQVLVAGGVDISSGPDVISFEVFDPATGVWTPLAVNLNVDRSEHSATLLPDGRLLFVGGVDPLQGPPASYGDYEVLDLTAMACNQAAAGRRDSHTATLLPDGRVLVAGGQITSSLDYSNTPNCALFDPAVNSWTATGTLSCPRDNHTATLLRDGRVLLVGGWGGCPSASVDIFDPSTQTWALAAETTNEARDGHTATLLTDGRVLVAGGGETPGSFELLDPSTHAWIMPPSTMGEARSAHTATLLADGRVLVAGGGATPGSFELFDPSTDSWTMPGGTMSGARSAHTATLLADGSVLVAGGNGDL